MLKYDIRTVTVIGANGTMGRNISAIFASFGNAKVYMVSRDIKKSEAAKAKAYRSVRAESVKENMIPADYSMLEQCIRESDLVFESASEDWEIKSSLTKMVSDYAVANLHVCRNTLFCTGTSGLSVTRLSELFPESLRSHYMGMHFFNPPYTMSLCEMIPTKYSDREVFEAAKAYCSEKLYRTVVEVKDSPAFLGNRIGFQFINEALQYAEQYRYNGGIDYIDAIMGPFTGRAMAPLVTSNFVGLDVHRAIVSNLFDNTDDFAHETFRMPEYAVKLIEAGNLGRKSGAGLYKTYVHDSGAKIHQVYDIVGDGYRNVMKYTFPFAEAMIHNLKKGEYDEAFKILKTNYSPEAVLCLEFLIKYVLYSLTAGKEVGHDIHSADDVMAAGFNWCPPLALIEALGGTEEFGKLCEERLNDDLKKKIDIKGLLQDVEPSRYDFRRFVKAKR